jgi:energy-coupling factor transporter ATP-binding protein EcfA2
MGTDPSLDISDELIEAHELAAVYGSLTALRGINLSVRPGEVVAPGAKGAGKTKRLLTLDGVLPTSRTRNSRRERYHCTTAPSLPAAGHGPLQTAIDARRRLTPRDRRYDTLSISPVRAVSQRPRNYERRRRRSAADVTDGAAFAGERVEGLVERASQPAA